MTGALDTGVGIVLSSVPWYWRIALRIQNLIDTQPKQYLATLLAGACFFAFLLAIHRAVGPLKRRYDNDGVDILESFVGSLGAVITSVFLLFVWRLAGELQDALRAFTIDHQTGVLALVTFVMLSITYSMTRVTKRLIKYTDRIEFTPHQRELAHHGVQVLLFATAISFVFALWEYDPTNLLIGASAIGVVLGFAARKTLSGVLSGFVILFGRPFEVGDWIAVGDWEGIVTEITIYNTQIRTFNEEHVLIPNDTVTDAEIINYSKTDRLRLITEIGIDYECDVATAAGVATEAMTSCDSVTETPPPDVVRQSFGDSAVVLELRYWIDRPTVQMKLNAQNEVIEAVKDAFEEEEIKIPYPQRELLGREETDGLRVVAEQDGPARGEAKRATRQAPSWESTTTVEEPVEEDYGDDLEGESEMKDATAEETEAESGGETAANGGSESESKDKPTEAEE